MKKSISVDCYYIKCTGLRKNEHPQVNIRLSRYKKSQCLYCGREYTIEDKNCKKSETSSDIVSINRRIDELQNEIRSN